MSTSKLPVRSKTSRRRFMSALMGVAVGLCSTALMSASAEAAHPVRGNPARQGKWMEVLLEEQRLVAWDDGRMVRSLLVSTGTRKTPTPRGTFRIFRKYDKQRMSGPGYDLPNVPWVMYFRRGGYALHGTYWHNNFGRPMSHGCINLPIGDAAWLYQWAPNGTVVVVR